MIGTGKVGSCSLFIHDVEDQNTSGAFVLELVQALAHLDRRPFDLDVLNFLVIECGGELLNQIGELNENQNAVFLWDLIPGEGI